MKLAEYCDTTTSYIGHIETGRKFPSMEMIEKIAAALRIKPYHFFIDRTEENPGIDSETTYPKMPKSMQKEIRNEINSSMNELVREILEKY